MYQDDMDMWEWEQEHGSQDGLFDPMQEERDAMLEALDDELKEIIDKRD